MEILNRFQYKLQENNDLTPIDDISASKIFHKIIANLEWNNSWKKTSSLPSLRGAINDLKTSGITPDDFSAIISQNEQILNDI